MTWLNRKSGRLPWGKYLCLNPLTEDNRQALVSFLQNGQEQSWKMIQTGALHAQKKALQALKEEPLSCLWWLAGPRMIRDEDLLLTKLKRQLRVLDKARQDYGCKGRDRASEKMATTRDASCPR